MSDDVANYVYLFRSIALSVPSVEGGDEFNGWQHGSCRRTVLPNGNDVYFYRQAVRNKYTQEIKGFAVSVPLEFCGEVKAGQSIDISKGMSGLEEPDEFLAMARESFLKLQELVVEWHHKETI